jgi:chain length determinant protein EpsF
VTITVVISLILPSQYTAKSAVVVDVKSPDPIAGVVLQGVMLPSYMATQVNIIESERVAQRVIRSLRLNESPQMQEQWRTETDGVGDFVSWLAGKLQKNLEVKPERESNVINISYTATDPTFAAALTNAFVSSYIATTIDLRVEPAKQYSALFIEQSKQLRDQLEQAQAKLSAYQQQKGLIGTDERLDVENARLNDLSSQLVALQALSAESAGRKAQSSANSAEVLGNPVVAGLKADMSRQEARLQEYSAKFGPAHPQVVELRANIQELRDKIDSEISRVTSSLSINNTVNQSREAQIRSALEAQRQKILRLKEQRDEAAVLVRDVENAQRAYDTMQARFYQTSLESQSNQANVSVLQVASPPPSSSSPRIFLNTALALVLGTFLALGVTLALELSDRRLRSTEDFTSVLNVPLIGIVPKVDVHQSGKREGGGTLFLSKKITPELTGPGGRI